MENDYHNWLCNLMRADLPEHRDYNLLLNQLDETEFTWTVFMDKNRYADALSLREEYFEETGVKVSGMVSCMEVLAALSKRIEIHIMGEPGNDHIERWFWIMLENLGVLIRDYRYDPMLVEHKLSIWLDRKFDKNGNGGLFPLRKSGNSQRDVDIWYQMQAYLNENYTF